MATTIVPRIEASIAPDRHPGWFTLRCRTLLLSQLRALKSGCITLHDHEGVHTLGQGVLSTTLRVHDVGFYRDAVLRGSNGAAEAFIAGKWTCDDLTTLVRILARDLQTADRMDTGPARFAAWLARVAHSFRRNSAAGSKRNIHAHYDLGNDFFEVFLDPTMAYSCALFESADQSLHDAQVSKYNRIAARLDLQPTDHLVEIGTGWGGLAMHVARTVGCRITTTTISREQYDLAVRRVAQAGLADRVTVLLQDYRTLRGQFDKLVSIEMIEAVGHQYYPAFFRQCAALLKPEGVGLIQAITIADQRYEQARRTVDFIKKYVFPGSCIPSVTAMCSAMTRASDLRLVQLEDHTAHYATTLRRWHDALFARREEAIRRGYPEALLRLWDFYLCYCEGGFLERTIGLVHMRIARPGYREGQGLELA